MIRSSLRLRLAIAASVLVALALALAGIGLVVIFDRVLDERAADELDRSAKFLTGQIALSPTGALTIGTELPDPRFATPYGGQYWQVEAADGRELRSRSLWDARLDRDALAAAPAAPLGFALAGPDGQRLIAVTRRFAIDRGGHETRLAVTVAMDRRDLESARANYVGLLVPSLVALGLVLAMAMWLFVARALVPFRTLRLELKAVQDGQRSALPGHFPTEVQPLVDGLNRLIQMQETALARARAQAGDMAHGLKTPLAVLESLARNVAPQDPELAQAIEGQALAMGRQVERSLARARAAAAQRLARQSCLVAPIVEKLVVALRRLPEADSLRWEVSLPEELCYPCEDGDLTELLGNLLDNARKWAHRTVAVTGGRSAEGLMQLSVEDDGPGMSETAMSRVARGRRWDETVTGTGFGLAIAAELAEETGGELTLQRSALGGLRVALRWGQDGSIAA
ncbi:sensor histidine kinase [Bosea beijingensis]|uniref:sensor histidine kinase n=1 Tax=Bosea beijingensis TaxID=3068632 RepID=UPI002741EAE8|nr:sensor histidine kinase [Bosea sp. REN20]